MGDEDAGGFKKNPVFSGDFQSNQQAKWLDAFLEKTLPGSSEWRCY